MMEKLRELHLGAPRPDPDDPRPSVRWRAACETAMGNRTGKMVTGGSCDRVTMKMRLTSAGIRNASSREALVELLGKPITEASALCIPTAMYEYPMVGLGQGARRFISGREAENPMCELGWKTVGVLELTALPSIDEARWVPLVRETDVLLVAGGDALFLCHWMRQSGLTDLLPSLGTVWVGLSAGSMVMTPRIGRDFIE